MTTKSVTAIVAATIAATLTAALATAAAAQTLTSTRTAAAPMLDGAGGAEWASAEPLAVVVNQMPYKPSNGYDGVKETTVTLRAMHDDAHLYMLIEWDDPTMSLERQPWVKQADGSWRQRKSPDDTGHENTYYEDKFAMLWDINARGFAKKGCGAVCHMAENGMIEGLEAKSPGRKFTAEGQTVDMWHWKSVRSGPVNQFDDQYIDSNTDAKANSGWGRHGDAKTGGGYSDNTTEDKTLPAFMPADGSSGAFWVEKANAVPFVDAFEPGAVLPGIVISTFEGSRGDISAVSNWADGKWTVEMKRALVTTAEKDAVQDVQFSDLSKAYPFGVAVFDNAAINHVYHEGAVELRFAD